MSVSSTAAASQERLGILVQSGLLAGPFLSMVDSSVINVAIPEIARSFGDPVGRVQWVVSAYLLAMASGLAASAYLARRFGTKQVYVVSLVGFTAASIACALAPSTSWLVTTRVIQGLFGAPMTPLAMVMLMGGEGARQRISPAAGIVLFLPPAVGPSLGGLLIAHFGWPSVFVLNAPFGLFGVLGVLKLSPTLVPERDASARFDSVGLVMLAAGLALSTYGASEGPAVGWWSVDAWPFWSAGLVLLLAYAVRGRLERHPAVDLRLLSERNPAIAIALSVVAALVLFAVLFLIPVFTQDVQGLSPAQAGLILLPQGLAMAFSIALGDVTTRRRSLLRPSVIAGFAILTLTTGALLLIQAGTPAWETALLLCGRGLALGLIIQPLLVATLGELPQAQLADANTLFNIVDRVGGSFGVALIATFFQASVQSHIEAAFGSSAVSGASLSGLGEAPAAARASLLNAATAGFHDTVWLLIGLGAIGLLVSLLLTSRDLMPDAAENIRRSGPG